MAIEVFEHASTKPLCVTHVSVSFVCLVFTKSALPSALLVLLVHSYMWSTSAVPIQNLLFGTEYLVM